MEAGLKGEFDYLIDEEMAAGHLEVKVLSTPSLVALMEISCHKTVEKYLRRGETTVGTYVCIHHKAPAPVGENVKVIAELENVDGRKLTFKVAAYWRGKLIGDGEHHRFIVNENSFAKKIKEEVS